MAEVGTAFVTILPSTRGFGSRLNGQMGPAGSSAGQTAGRSFGKAFGALAAVGAAAALGKFIKDAVGLEAQFSQTMNTVGAVANVNGKELEKLSDLALQMGKDTSFSASEASDALLELAKGGMSAATIEAGGLAGTLQLAAAGGTSMETAATIASNAMNAFSLKGRDMASVAAALAGGANASSASVESLGQALSQVGPGAVNAGLSLQETVATLSAFDAAGIKGSDAGTSLKTMLTRLIPQTNKAASAMDDLGLDFVKGNGEFESMTNIAGQLQKRLGGLTEAQRSQALTTIFGSDASRAAAVLMNEGAGGIRKFIKATQDQGAAQRAADARMKGTAGAIEEFKGSIETAQIELGLLFAPYIQSGLALLTRGVNSLGPALSSMGAALVPVGATLSQSVMPALQRFGTYFQTTLLPIIVSLAQTITTSFLPAIRNAATNFTTLILPALQRLGGYLVSTFGPVFAQVFSIIQTRVIPILGAIATYVTGTVQPALVAFGQKIAANVKPAFDQLAATFQAKILPALNKVLAKWQEWGPTITTVLKHVAKLVGGLLLFYTAVAGKVLPIVIKIIGFMAGAWISAFIAAANHVQRVIGVMSAFAKGVQSAVSTAVTAVGRFLNAVQDKFGAAVAYVKGIPGKMKSAIGNLGSLLYSAGSSLIQGLIDGIQSKVSALTSKLSSITKLIPDVKGPPKKDAKLLTPAGRLIMGGLIAGLDDGVGPLKRAAQKITDALGNAMESGTEGATKRTKEALQKLIDGVKSKMDTLKSQFESIKSEMSSLADSIAQSFSVDLFSSETVDDFLAAAQANIESIRSADWSRKKLMSKGATADFVADLFASGNQALIKSLTWSNPAQVQQAESLYGQRNSLATQLGATVGNDVYGADLRGIRSELQGLRKDTRGLAKEFAAAMNNVAKSGNQKGRTRQKGKAA